MFRALIESTAGGADRFEFLKAVTLILRQVAGLCGGCG